MCRPLAPGPGVRPGDNTRPGGCGRDSHHYWLTRARDAVGAAREAISLPGAYPCREHILAGSTKIIARIKGGQNAPHIASNRGMLTTNDDSEDDDGNRASTRLIA